MQHAPLRRIANYGRKIAAGAALELAAIEELDARVSHMQKRQRQVQADALAAATAGFDTPALERQHAVIVRMMKAHDWTWREADRFYHHCADHEDRMLAALAEIPEAAAAGLWHLHAPVSYWS
jgi:hypothetical protein